LDLLVERMCQLVAEQAAGRIIRQRFLALLDRSIDDPEISFDDRNGRRVELRLSLGDDLLEHVDLSTIYDFGLFSLAGQACQCAALGSRSSAPCDARTLSTALSVR